MQKTDNASATQGAPLGRSNAAIPNSIEASKLAVFCDFDGTFSRQDVGATLARTRLPERRAELWARYDRGELDPWGYNEELFDGFACDEGELGAFLATIDLDAGAKALLAFCEGRKLPFEILSDGFDYNLDRLQVLHGVRFEYRANHLRIEDGRWRISPGGRNAACGCGTGSCKRARIAEHRAAHPGAFCVHVGNGRVSDLCGALAADLAFAKETLADALDAEGAPYARFETLHDVVAELDERLVGEPG